MVDGIIYAEDCRFIEKMESTLDGIDMSGAEIYTPDESDAFDEDHAHDMALNSMVNDLNNFKKGKNIFHFAAVWRRRRLSLSKIFILSGVFQKKQGK